MIDLIFLPLKIYTKIHFLCFKCRSDSGASPDEAVSWGKIKRDATPVKVIFLICFARKKALFN